MLVLLVLFMVTAPILNVGVKVDLPQAHAPTLVEKAEPLNVVVTADGSIFLSGLHGDTRLDLNTLVPKLLAITNANAETRIYIQGSRRLSYGRILEVMSCISRAGFKHIVLVAETPKKDNTRKPRRSSVRDKTSF
jgi:biopolymer transport protein TolR